jgi:hypothetical protein
VVDSLVNRFLPSLTAIALAYSAAKLVSDDGGSLSCVQRGCVGAGGVPTPGYGGGVVEKRPDLTVDARSKEAPVEQIDEA